MTTADLLDLTALAALAFPDFDPVAVRIPGVGLAIRWYALAYVVGLIGAWRYCRWLTRRSPSGLTPEDFDDFLFWATLGVLLGGRLGYVVFYKAGYYLEHPLEVLFLWQGGMAFHGGFLGVILAAVLFARKRGVPILCLGDLLACAAPIGLLLGRIANFINGELYGRASDVAWAMVFPSDPLQVPRHPSQLYEAALEGLLLLVVFFLMVRAGALARPGLLSGGFLLGYGGARAIVELFREPDAHLGLLAGGATMGQLLSAPMILAGLALIVWSRRRPPA